LKEKISPIFLYHLFIFSCKKNFHNFFLELFYKLIQVKRNWEGWIWVLIDQLFDEFFSSNSLSFYGLIFFRLLLVFPKKFFGNFFSFQNSKKKSHRKVLIHDFFFYFRLPKILEKKLYNFYLKKSFFEFFFLSNSKRFDLRTSNQTKQKKIGKGTDWHQYLPQKSLYFPSEQEKLFFTYFSWKKFVQSWKFLKKKFYHQKKIFSHLCCWIETNLSHFTSNSRVSPLHCLPKMCLKKNLKLKNTESQNFSKQYLKKLWSSNS